MIRYNNAVNYYIFDELRSKGNTGIQFFSGVPPTLESIVAQTNLFNANSQMYSGRFINTYADQRIAYVISGVTSNGAKIDARSYLPNQLQHQFKQYSAQLVDQNAGDATWFCYYLGAGAMTTDANVSDIFVLGSVGLIGSGKDIEMTDVAFHSESILSYSDIKLNFDPYTKMD